VETSRLSGEARVARPLTERFQPTGSAHRSCQSGATAKVTDIADRSMVGCATRKQRSAIPAWA
jgi:hypothetical protein